MWHNALYAAALASCAGYALLRGGAPERLAVGVILVGSLISPLLLRTAYLRVEWAVLAIDVLDQIGLTMIMLAADRFWPIPLVGLHLLEPMIGLTKGAVPAIRPRIYALTEHGLAYLLLALIAAGVFRHRERLRRYGADPSWNGYSPAWTGRWRPAGRIG